MTKIRVNGIHDPFYFHMGVQTTPENLDQEIKQKIKTWSPKSAKSYTVFDLIHTDYHDHPVDHVTGYALFKVQYFTSAMEGKEKL